MIWRHHSCKDMRNDNSHSAGLNLNRRVLGFQPFNLNQFMKTALSQRRKSLDDAYQQPLQPSSPSRRKSTESVDTSNLQRRKSTLRRKISIKSISNSIKTLSSTSTPILRRKIVCIGDGGIGKTSFLQYYSTGSVPG